jgi:hypothetical protein
MQHASVAYDVVFGPTWPYFFFCCSYAGHGCMPGEVKRGREGDAPIPPHKGALRERAH